MIQFEVLLCVMITLIGGILIARRLYVCRQKNILDRRLSILAGEIENRGPTIVVKPKSLLDRTRFPATNALLQRIEKLINRSGVRISISTFLNITCALLLLPPALSVTFGNSMLLALGVGLVLAAIPSVVLFIKRSLRRSKFITQLPDAIDLIISILRSGHSIPQAIKTVGDESPLPCGEEFNEIMQRINLGQSLAESLGYSCEKYKSKELDLLRRAVSIQAEVGGSLAELLEKTNATLRQRIKLVRHVKVLTAQSRLTAGIVGLLPICIAVGLQVISPNYLTPLFETQLGRILLTLAVVLQIFGIGLMSKMATVKV